MKYKKESKPTTSTKDSEVDEQKNSKEKSTASSTNATSASTSSNSSSGTVSSSTVPVSVAASATMLPLTGHHFHQQSYPYQQPYHHQTFANGTYFGRPSFHNQSSSSDDMKLKLDQTYSASGAVGAGGGYFAPNLHHVKDEMKFSSLVNQISSSRGISAYE